MARIAFSELIPDDPIEIDEDEYKFSQEVPSEINISLVPDGISYIIKVSCYRKGRLRISTVEDAQFIIDSLTDLLAGE